MMSLAPAKLSKTLLLETPTPKQVKQGWDEDAGPEGA
jgi:hypothetical protein